MQKKFFKNLVLVLVLNVLVKPFYILGIDAEILKQVETHSPGDYGEYFSLMSLTFILNIFLDLGINNYNTRNLARYSHLFRKYFAGILSIRFLLSFGYIILVIITGFILGYDASQFNLLSLLILNQIIIAFIQYFRSNLAGLLLFKQDSIISILDRSLLIVICSVMLWGGITNEPIRIEWFVLAQTASYFITFLVAGYLVLKRAGKFRASLRTAFSWMIIKKSLPYALLILLMTIYYRSDSVMLERMSADGARDAAVYARGYRFFEALNMVGYLFAGLLLPIFAKLLKQKEDISQITTFSLKLILSYAFLVATAAFFYREEIMSWRFEISGNELIESSLAFGILMICFVFFTSLYIYGTILTANGSLRVLNISAGIGVLVNITLNLYMIPIYGAFGAAIASLITQILTAIIQISIAHNLIKLHIDLTSLLRIIGYFIVIVLIIMGSTHLKMPWYYSFSIAIATGILVALLSGMISIREIRTILQSGD